MQIGLTVFCLIKCRLLFHPFLLFIGNPLPPPEDTYTVSVTVRWDGNPSCNDAPLAFYFPLKFVDARAARLQT